MKKDKNKPVDNMDYFATEDALQGELDLDALVLAKKANNSLPIDCADRFSVYLKMREEETPFWSDFNNWNQCDQNGMASLKLPEALKGSSLEAPALPLESKKSEPSPQKSENFSDKDDSENSDLLPSAIDKVKETVLKIKASSRKPASFSTGASEIPSSTFETKKT